MAVMLDGNEIISNHCIWSIEIINNTRGASRVKFGSAVMGGKLKSRMNMRHTILGLHLKPEKFKTRVTIVGIFISFTCFACHYYKNSPQILSLND